MEDLIRTCGNSLAALLPLSKAAFLRSLTPVQRLRVIEVLAAALCGYCGLPSGIRPWRCFPGSPSPSHVPSAGHVDGA